MKFVLQIYISNYENITGNTLETKGEITLNKKTDSPSWKICFVILDLIKI